MFFRKRESCNLMKKTMHDRLSWIYHIYAKCLPFGHFSLVFFSSSTPFFFVLVNLDIFLCPSLPNVSNPIRYLRPQLIEESLILTLLKVPKSHYRNQWIVWLMNYCTHNRNLPNAHAKAIDYQLMYEQKLANILVATCKF